MLVRLTRTVVVLARLRLPTTTMASLPLAGLLGRSKTTSPPLSAALLLMVAVATVLVPPIFDGAGREREAAHQVVGGGRGPAEGQYVPLTPTVSVGEFKPEMLSTAPEATVTVLLGKLAEPVKASVPALIVVGPL